MSLRRFRADLHVASLVNLQRNAIALGDIFLAVGQIVVQLVLCFDVASILGPAVQLAVAAL